MLQAAKSLSTFPTAWAGRSFPWASMDKILKMTVTGRNLSTVTTLLKMAEEMEGALR